MTAHSPIPLFRPEVLAARRDRLHGDISLAVPLSWQLIGYLLFGALTIALGFLALATYSRVETISGAIVVDKGIAAIVPTRPGVIADLAVREGQHVHAGDLLARVRSEEDLANGATAPQRILDSLDQQDRQLGNQADLVLNAAAADQARLEATVRGSRDEIRTIEQQMTAQQQLVALAANDLDQAESIAAKGFISRRDIDDRKATLLARRQQLSQLEQAKAAKLTTISDAQRSIAQSKASSQAQAVSVQSQRTQLQQQMAQYDAAQGYALTSPVSGTVTALTARLGQPAAQGEQLMVVLPDGGRTRVELYVPTSAAGFLKKGQEVRVAVDAFPYETFGTVQARITDISSTVVQKQGPNGPVPVYLVTAEFGRTRIQAFGKAQPLQPGMTLTARIVTRKQSLFEWLFEPLFAVGRR
ncbi:HlyD family secretion protein [Sphingomonas segetis]|uniref:HlyD family secretion protein n=1 Tax=Sphingomonas segetis TaxID=1104779 RepID=UPI0018AD3F4F|nr:HlyD family efflux transporter periplasmic adaptor subunit [Sphingomonas segetis]